MKHIYIPFFFLLLSQPAIAQETIPVTFDGKRHYLPENADLTFTHTAVNDTLFVTFEPKLNFSEPDLMLIEMNASTYKFSSSSIQLLRQNLMKFEQLILTLSSDETKTLTIDKAPVIVEPETKSKLAEPIKVTGSMVTDALRLDSLEKRATPEIFTDFKAKILAAYSIVPAENPFARHVGLTMQRGGIVSKTNQGSTNLLDKALGLNVTNLADGLARLFVKRSKQELNAAFFDKLKNLLDNPAYRDLKLVFPETHATLFALGDEIYNYEAYLTTLRESFQQDLKTLPPHMQKWLYEGTLASYLEEKKEIRASAFTALYIYEQLSTDVHPGDLIAGFPIVKLEGLKTIPVDIQGAKHHLRVDGLVKVFIELSKSLAGETDGTYWVSDKSVNTLLKNEKARMYYLAMLFESVKDVKVLQEGKTMGEFLIEWSSNIKTEIDPKTKLLGTFIDQTRQLEQKISVARKEDISDSLRFERYYNVFEEFTATLRSGYKLTQNWLPIPATENPTCDKVLLVSDKAAKTGLYVARRKYGSAVVQAAGIYSFLVETAVDTTTIYIKELKNAFSKKVKLEWPKGETDVDKIGLKLQEQLRNSGLAATYAASVREISISIPGQSDVVVALDADPKKTLEDFKGKYAAVRIRPVLGKIVVRLPEAARERLAGLQIAKVNLRQNSKIVTEGLIKYGSMMAAVSEASNSQEVADAIEAFALPAGSSSIKRKSVFNVALNGYTGLLAGYEMKGPKGPFNSYAVWAPVGIAASLGNLGRGHSLSVFASIIDIGAVTAFRFSSKETIVSEIQLKDIVSPGASLSWGIARTPLSLAAGWQAAPFLRAVAADGNTNIDVRASRFHLTLAVDIPLLNFYNKKDRNIRKKK